jgi:hypothetical protein
MPHRVNLSFLLILKHNCFMRVLSRGRRRAAFFIGREVYHVHLAHLYPLPYKAPTPDPLSSPLLSP